MSSSITYTSVLDANRETAQFCSALLAAHRRTRTGTRALSLFKQAVFVLRWFLDATRVAPSWPPTTPSSTAPPTPTCTKASTPWPPRPQAWNRPWPTPARVG